MTMPIGQPGAEKVMPATVTGFTNFGGDRFALIGAAVETRSEHIAVATRVGARNASIT
jgi:hypothetical protein